MKRNKFSLSHYSLQTMDMGELVPIGCVPAMAGDTFQHHTSMLARAVAMMAPVMHKLNAHIHHWLCPTRLVWPEFEDFITGGKSGMAAPVPPTITFASVAKGSLANYLGVPVTSTPVTVSALPFRMFNLIWNTKYMDADIQTERVISLASGVDTTTDTTLPFVCWDKDFFTTARPWTQRGTEVTIPLTGDAPVSGIGFTGTPTTSGVPTGTIIRQTSPIANATVPATPDWMTVGGATYPVIKGDGAGSATVKPDVKADLSSVSGVNILDLRTASGIQRYRENAAAFGYRYSDYLNYRFGISRQDARLQEPEYLGGGRQVVQFSEVLQTAEGEDPVGTMRGHGIAAMKTNRYRAFIPEHGFILSLAFLRPENIYANALNKFWSIAVKEEYPTKELENIGRQAVLNKEIHVGHTQPDGIFGYQNQYDNFRRMNSRIAGDFVDTLAYWTMARIFSGDVALNDSFLKCQPSKRNFASETTDAFLVMANHKIGVRRFLSKDGSFTKLA